MPAAMRAHRVNYARPLCSGTYFGAPMITMLPIILAVTLTVSCPQPVYVLADKNSSTAVTFELTENGEKRTFTVTRGGNDFKIEYTTDAAPSTPSYEIFSKEMGVNNCNSISAEAAEFSYFHDSAIVLLMGYCNGSTPDSVEQMFGKLRIAPPNVAKELRSNLQQVTASKCPSTVKAFDILRQQYSPDGAQRNRE